MTGPDHQGFMQGGCRRPQRKQLTEEKACERVMAAGAAFTLV
jgi:hypothetical protein